MSTPSTHPRVSDEKSQVVSEKADTTALVNEQPSSVNALDRITSHVMPREGGLEAGAADGLSMLARSDSHQAQYIFKRLHAVRPLPGKVHEAAMLGTLFLVMFLAGWNDGSQGPLLPSLQAYYNVDYLIISIIWIFNALGFFIAGITNVYLTDRLGFGIVAPLGSGMQMTGYALMCWGGPYPLFCFAFVLNGFGLGLQDAQVNALTSRLSNATTKMFLMHAVYGLGATVSPLVSTQFVKRVQTRVYLYYAVSLGLAACTLAALILVFNFRTDDQIVGQREADVFSPVVSREPAALPSPDSPEATIDGQEPATPAVRDKDSRNNSNSGGKMKRILRTPSVHFMALFITIYVGVEVAIGGWATSFLIDERGGNNSSGYVSSGYFGGLTLGRVILIPVTSLLGQWNSVWIYTIVAIALEVVVWTTHTIIGNAVAFAFVGVAIGPLYPIVMMVCVDILPGELQSGAIGWIASLGQVGSAVMPFITGGISQRYGVWIMQPLMISLMGLWLILWAFVPRDGRRVRA